MTSVKKPSTNLHILLCSTIGCGGGGVGGGGGGWGGNVMHLTSTVHTDCAIVAV